MSRYKVIKRVPCCPLNAIRRFDVTKQPFKGWLQRGIIVKLAEVKKVSNKRSKAKVSNKEKEN